MGVENHPNKILSSHFGPNRFTLLRKKISSNLSGFSEEHISSIPLVKALLIGDKSKLTQAHWDLFKATGTIHLMAISGLHVGMVAGFCAAFALFIVRVLALLGFRRYSTRLISIFSFLGAFLYSGLAGFSIPTVRALLLVFAVNLAFQLGRKVNLFAVLLIVACLLQLWNPFSFFQSGFLLSFSAVAVLLIVFGSCYHSGPQSLVFIQAQIVVILGLLFVMASLGLETGLVAPLANVVAIPLITFLVLPLLFLSLPLLILNVALAETILIAVDAILNILLGYLNVLQALPIPSVLPNMGSLSSVALGVMAVLLWLFPKPFLLRPLSLLLFLAFALSGQTHFKKNPSLSSSFELRYTQFDVGQGTASAIAVNKEVQLVYDIGARYSESFSIANNLLTPYLRSQGATHIPYLVVSHGDNDHAGAFADFIQALSFQHIYTGEPEKLNVSAMMQCDVQSTFELDGGLSAVVLWPRLGFDALGEGKIKSNNRSCVVLVEFKGRQILLTGDIEVEVERYLLNHDLLPMGIDVLIAPHHGSRTSSSRAFVEQLRPKHVIFSAGYKNRYRHPAKTIVERYEQVGSRIWNTAYHGAIEVTIRDEELNVRAQRCSHSRLWTLDEGFCEG